ncbi:FAD/NAD(P)-binding protein [Agrobacterium vitis]
MKTSFAIVGCGSTAISFLHRYLSLVEAGDAEPNIVYVFEKKDIFVCGAAYEPDVPTNILNTKTGFITPFLDRPGHFKAWLDGNEYKWRRIFPNFDSHSHGYAPDIYSECTSPNKCEH